MKLFLFLLAFFPAALSAQTEDTTANKDMYGCYMHALRSYIDGNAGLKNITKATLGRKAKTIYIYKQFYTSGWATTLDGHEIRYVDIKTEAERLAKEQSAKKAAVIYISELGIGADTCSLWIMPVDFAKEAGVTVPDYKQFGCHLFYYVSKRTQKLGYAKTYCP